MNEAASQSTMERKWPALLGIFRDLIVSENCFCARHNARLFARSYHLILLTHESGLTDYLHFADEETKVQRNPRAKGPEMGWELGILATQPVRMITTLHSDDLEFAYQPPNWERLI